MKYLLTFALIGICLSRPSMGATHQDFVVMIESRIGETGRRESGAGIIIDEKPERTVIATALHVIEDKGGDKATEITVEFSGLRGRIYKATANSYYADPKLDLAVIFVDRRSDTDPPRVISDITRDAISPSKPKELAGSIVEIVGAMHRQRWAVGAKDDHIVSGDRDGLYIASAEARAGASGAGVFDSLGRLLGMGTYVDSSTGSLVAIPVSTLLESFAKWKLPTGLTIAAAGTTSAEISDRFAKDLRIVQEYIPSTSSQAPASHTFRITAQLKPSLLKLAPEIEIRYWEWVPENVKTFNLKPPNYSEVSDFTMIKVAFDAWVVVADGRRLGPFTTQMDFEKQPLAIYETTTDTPDFVWRKTLKNERMNLEIMKNNALQEQRTRAESKAQSDRVSEESAREQMKWYLGTLPEKFPNWDLRCDIKDEGWRCNYPLFAEQQLPKSLLSMRIGRDADNLSVEVPLLDIEEFRPAFAREAARLLTENPQMTDLFIKVQPRTGSALGPKRLCHVTRRADRAYCRGS